MKVRPESPRTRACFPLFVCDLRSSVSATFAFLQAVDDDSKFVNINTQNEEDKLESIKEPQDEEDDTRPTQWDSHLFELAAKNKIDSIQKSKDGNSSSKA